MDDLVIRSHWPSWIEYCVHGSLFSEIHWEADFIHDFTFDHRSSGNVVERASSAGLRLSLDHHRDGSHENLFTEFFAETDFGVGAVNVQGRPRVPGRHFEYGSRLLKPPWARIQANIVGDTTNELTLTEDEEWIEPVMDLVPVNLFRAKSATIGVGLHGPSDPDTSSPELKAVHVLLFRGSAPSGCSFRPCYGEPVEKTRKRGRSCLHILICLLQNRLHTVG